VPFANGDREQYEATVSFLKSNSVTVDIFGVMDLAGAAEAPASIGATAPSAAGPESAPAPSTLTAGEEGVTGAPPPPRAASAPAAPRLVAPLASGPDGATGVTLQRGREYLVEVVTRTRNVGHMFPGGTVDAFDVWVELKGEDEKGDIIFWSGWVEPELRGDSVRRGPVDPGAHFYRSVLLDGHGNLINKRNAWAARALLYARLIPPGAADTTHFRVKIPPDCGGKLTFTAKVNYRKFAWWNTQWAYAGVRDPAQSSFDLSPHYDDGRWVFTGDASRSSGALKEIPDLPIVELAADTRSFSVSERAVSFDDPPAAAAADLRSKMRERYNDYGIGLLLQKDYSGAIAAFSHVIRIDPGYADGFVNLARAQIEEGNHQAARASLDNALALAPDLPRAHYFYALTLKSAGRYDQAIERFSRTLETFPRDRVVLNQLGRVLFLLRRHAEAIAAFRRTLAVDPEDLQAHYNLMLCYRATGDTQQAKREEILYARFKADESSQELTGPRRLTHPEENNERQLIHDHVSTWRARTDGRQPHPGRYAGP
jgi:tetratricopeptide (TPR) repeat protein